MICIARKFYDIRSIRTCKLLDYENKVKTRCPRVKGQHSFLVKAISELLFTLTTVANCSTVTSTGLEVLKLITINFIDDKHNYHIQLQLNDTMTLRL